MYLPQGIIREYQNNPEKRPVFHAERRNEEGEEHGEEGGVHRSAVVVVVVETRRLSVSLSLALLSARARRRILFKAKLNTFLFC